LGINKFHLKYGFLFKDIHVICMQNRSTRTSGQTIQPAATLQK